MRVFLTTILMFLALPAGAQNNAAPAKVPDLTGIYQAVPLNTTLPGGLKGAGTLADLALQPAASEKAKARDLKDDPAKNCQVIGPFRMMARDDNKIEMVASDDRIAVMFENTALGNIRWIYTRRAHPAKLQPSWMGDSTGTWEGDTLVVDTVGFNESTWLNDLGAPHSANLHLVERFRLLPGGKYLEYKMTAEDPQALAKPYSYARYYEKTNVELKEDFCGR